MNSPPSFALVLDHGCVPPTPVSIEYCLNTSFLVEQTLVGGGGWGWKGRLIEEPRDRKEENHQRLLGHLIRPPKCKLVLGSLHLDVQLSRSNLKDIYPLPGPLLPVVKR